MNNPLTNTEKDPRPLWSSLAERFSTERECLATYIALETAEVLAEAKPASLLCITNRERACGRNLYTIWKEHGHQLLADTPLEACELIDRGSSMMILFSHRVNFKNHLARRDITALLKRAGHGSDITPDDLLRCLADHLQHGHFPHEIGLLLGYPPKDVAAFMGLINIPFTCQGPWKIYGNPVESLRLAERFRNCRNLMAEQLSLCASAVQCLGGFAGARQAILATAY
ncbi:DUF3793 family protein [Pelotalea chapellei]|uniref:DUF3793 family protein n=1 Tax=Pelotalea chapellei TaxID=44671 RepID=A0ABS5UAC5_9BACT|nr:DUF3793 family protein [Pelotalea chapellei]MBT1072624.1 DUF3793 family protein [Pelotalea chapellei]